MEDDRHTVALAGLLHDVGKVINRAREVVELRHELDISHSAMSQWLVEHFYECFPDSGLVGLLVRHHHENPLLPVSQLVQSIDDSDLRTLALIISRADNYASGERGGAWQGGFRRGCPLDSVFSDVSLGRGEANKTGYNQYHLQPLRRQAHFPESIDIHDDDELTDHLHGFANEFKAIVEMAGGVRFDTLLYMLEKYCWCVPDDTTRRPSDISLFDHMKVTSALAACSYIYHVETDTLTEQAVQDNDLNRFLLVGGDLGGIQRYLYDVAAVGRGKIAKRLRARSFYLWLLVQAAVEFLLRRLDLPRSCVLMATGGQFFILAPNGPKSVEGLRRARGDISDWLMRELHGELFLTIDWAQISGKDLQLGQAARVIQDVKDRLNRAKRVQQLPDEPVIGVSFDNGVCDICRRYESAQPAPEGERFCRHCQADEEVGKRLTETRYLCFHEGPESQAGLLAFFQNPTICIDLVCDKKQIPDTTRLLLNVRDTELTATVSLGFRFLATRVPRFSDRQELDDLCRNCSQKGECDFRARFSPRDTKSFDCLAAMSKGEKLLGVLRADVDRLGLIFTLGLEPDSSDADQGSSRATLSRLCTMSRMLDYFFCGHVAKLIECSEQFRGVYPVYSGGDDLMMIGPWDQIVSLTGRLYHDFRKYVACNPDITLSAGVALVKPHVPVSVMAKLAGQHLERAKAEGRNRFSILGTTATWDHFDKLIKWAQVFAQMMRPREGREGVSRAFLYRLLQYCTMAETADPQSNPRGFLWQSRLAYDISRNLCQDSGEPKAGFEEAVKVLRRLLGSEGQTIMPLLRMPLNCALLSTRGG